MSVKTTDLKGFQVQLAPADAAFRTVELLLAGKRDDAAKCAAVDAGRARDAIYVLLGPR